MEVNHEIRNLIEKKELLIGRRDNVTTTRGVERESIKWNSSKVFFSYVFLLIVFFEPFGRKTSLFVKVFTENLLKSKNLLRFADFRVVVAVVARLANSE